MKTERRERRRRRRGEGKGSKKIKVTASVFFLPKLYRLSLSLVSLFNFRTL